MEFLRFIVLQKCVVICNTGIYNYLFELTILTIREYLYNRVIQTPLDQI